MKNMNKTILALCLSLNVMQSPVQAAVLPTIGLAFTTGISVTNALTYITTSLLVQEKHLVKAQYPYAQQWYEAMVIKYPTAHLDQKLFLQTWRDVNSKYVQHCSWFYNIYFPQESLENIDTLYKKVIDGQTLTEQEQISLGKEEFLLLHEAAHIEHSDVFARCITMSGILAGLTGVAQIHESLGTQDQAISFLNDKLELGFAGATVFHHYGLIIMGAMIYATGFNAVAHPQEVAADKFACDLADVNALQGGITFFEDKTVDPLIDIENEVVSPFIPVESYVGQKIQSWFQAQDEQNLVDLKNIKLNPDARTAHHAERDPVHPSPSSRVLKIKEEIERRLQAEVATECK
jgi:hypothetical protein